MMVQQLVVLFEQYMKAGEGTLPCLSCFFTLVFDIVFIIISGV